MSRQRVSAIIIQDKKILLVHEKDIDHRSTPGGGIDDDETHEDTLRRELAEGLDITIETMKPYLSYTGTNAFYQIPQIDHSYIVTYSGNPSTGSGVRNIARFTKEELTSINITKDQKKWLIPALLQSELL